MESGGIAALADELIHRHSSRTPYLSADHKLTHGGLRFDVAARAAIFAASGVGAASTVMVQLPPSFTQIELVLALWTLDAQVLLVDHRLKPAELETLCRMCRPQFLVHTGITAGHQGVFRPRYEVVTEKRPGGLPAGTDHRLVQFSSGSTGTPKVVGRTAASLRAEIARFGAVPGMPGAGEKVLLLSSTSHSFGLIAGLLYSLTAGVEVVFAPKVSARELTRTATERAVDAVFGVPFHYELISSIGQAPRLPALRLAVSGGELMPRETALRFANRYGVQVGESYGTTETGVIAMDASGALRPTVGPPAPGMQIRVQDGELQVRLVESPYLPVTVQDGYRGGWFRTRDRAELTADGSVRLFGRSDSMVVTGGLKVDLMEVELALRGHPLVTEVVVVYDRLIEAYVGAAEPAPTANELIAWCRERLADYKIPKALHVLPALPRTPNGKLVRSHPRLRASAAGLTAT